MIIPTDNDQPFSMDSMSERLRWARNHAGHKSGKTAAAAAMVKYSTYRAHESGQNRFAAQDAAVYAYVFGVSPQWLLDGSGAPDHAKIIEPPPAYQNRKARIQRAETIDNEYLDLQRSDMFTNRISNDSVGDAIDLAEKIERELYTNQGKPFLDNNDFSALVRLAQNTFKSRKSDSSNITFWEMIDLLDLDVVVDGKMNDLFGKSDRASLNKHEVEELISICRKAILYALTNRQEIQ